MEGSFSNIINQPDRNDIAPNPIVIQQYARYPPALEPGLQSASSLGSARSHLATSKSPPLHRKVTPRSIQASPTGMRSGMPPTSVSRPGPSMSPPVFDPPRQRPPRESIDQTETRSLPSRDISDDTIDDAYVMFIFYCNPNVPLSADTSELRKTFRCPPRSDGKSFSIFTLWELIRKLDSKELKTWHALAIELGVEPPVIEQKQSTQKVQQYAVRLKRWMRAMHVDAFFEYCLGHPHPYYNQLPANNTVSESRDGVPLEEDLALRALLPQWKPKRGRKRAEERESANDRLTKRPQLDTSVNVLRESSFPGASSFPQSAIPFSAFTEDMEPSDPWMVTQPSFTTDAPSDPPAPQQSQDTRWRPIERAPSPANYPQSAIIPRDHHPSEVFLPPTEPRSAVTPSTGEKTRPKRRHGPAVSSAWPSTNGSTSGKTRGRPPNKGTVSGPFSSFPVNPARSGPVQLQSSGTRASPAIILEQDPSGRFSQSQYNQSPTPFNGSRPNKLQLQVPQHSGAPVRLATPPTLMVNGVNNPSLLKVEGTLQNGTSISSDGFGRIASGEMNHGTEHVNPDDVVRVFSGELIRAKSSGRSVSLGVEEARVVATSVVRSLMASYTQSPANIPALMVALNLGIGQHFGYPGVLHSSISVHIDVAPIEGSRTSNAHNVSPNYIYTISLEYTRGLHFAVKITTSPNKSDDLSEAIMDMETSIVDIDSLTDAEYELDTTDSNVSETTWKQRYQKLRAQMQKKERSLSQYKRRILESVMADL
ncbi:hypothetical protein FE257_011260 [Aspergillus nanangensis]|uniref:ARS binding protein Abp2 n=1 Tax=Aspergillus nanangensis TaxID=2582783 RepID=A0AAD4CHK7_ASPNN|nr:hypothetical protein FE257_011260 [Aspergillus nanangensis]